MCKFGQKRYIILKLTKRLPVAFIETSSSTSVVFLLRFNSHNLERTLFSITSEDYKKLPQKHRSKQHQLPEGMFYSVVKCSHWKSLRKS